MLWRKLILISLFIGIFSCNSNKNTKEAQMIVKEWKGKEILFTDNLQCCIVGKDTIPEFCNNLFQKEYKVLLYVDSIGCSSCRLKLVEWKRLISESDSLFHGQLGFLLFFQPKNRKEMTFMFKQFHFDYPVFIDMNNIINRLNHFPQQQSYQCFLLDSNNKVLMIGNPTLNPKIWDLYKQIISGKISDKPPITIVEPEQSEIELKDLQTGKTSEAIFKLKNTGTQPLIIRRVDASCGCTVPEWDKQPIAAGKSTEIKVKITPERREYFNKTVTVHCNTEKGRISLIVKGTVE
jgi:hypothetical protein